MFEAIPSSQSSNGFMYSYFLRYWRNNSQALSWEPNSEWELPPTLLDSISSSGGFSVVGQDRLSVSYPNVDLHGYDVGVVQADRPAPMLTLVYYFEIFVKNAGSKGQIAIGFTTSAFTLPRQPGWEANSYGYHGNDGMLYRGSEKGDKFGPTYTTGDTVGGGINYATQQFFFTKNGVVVGSAIKDVRLPVYPTVAVHSQNEQITVNFGKDPFVFDVKSYEEEYRSRQQMDIDKISIPQNTGYGIVRSYLQHYGYEETLRLFDVACKSTIPPITLVTESVDEVDSTYALDQRRALRQLIRCGQIDEVFDKLREWYPLIIQDETSMICFLLHCQKFLELITVGKLEDAIFYGRSELLKFKRLKEFVYLVKDCGALLAYEQPYKSYVGYLLQESQRELVADAVNAMILSMNPNVKNAKFCMLSSLEILIRQLTACFLERRRTMFEDQGEAFHLGMILDSSYK